MDGIDTAYTAERLFLGKEPYGDGGLTKEAAVTLSRDGDDWEEEISQSLHREHPYIAEHNIQINLTNVDPETGAGVGSIQIDDKVLVPIIIEKFKLAPLDLFWFQDKLHPLTRTSLEGTLQETNMGTPVVPGQGEMTDVSLYSRMQPPFDGKYTYASVFGDLADGAGMEVGLAEAFSTEEGLRFELQSNEHFREVVQAFVSGSVEKRASQPEKSRIVVRTYRPFTKVAAHGAYEVATDQGTIPALLFDNVMSATAEVMSGHGVLVGLNKEAGYARLSPGQEVAGRPCDPTVDVPVGEPAQRDRGVFFKMAAKGAVCTEPVTIQFRVADGWSARDDMNQVRRIVKTAGLTVPVYGDRTLCIPDDWHWIKVGRAVDPMEVYQANMTEPGHGLHSFELRHHDGRYVVRGLDGFPADGDDHEKTASLLSMRFNDQDVAKVMAAAPEVGTLYLCERKPPEEPMSKVAEAAVARGLGRVNLIKEATYVSPCNAFRFPVLPGKMIKVSAVTDDASKQTVDSLLGLNFLNPDNLYRFADKVTIIEEAKEVVAKLLLASRLGLDVDSRPLRSSMFALDSVERDLRELQNAVEVEEQEG